MLKLQCVTVDCRDPRKVAEFWAAALGWQITFSDENETAVECVDAQSSIPFPDLLFLRDDNPKSVKNRLHLDLRPDDQTAEVARLEALGATHIDIGQSESASTTWVVMADPEGNEFCVLRPRPDNVQQ